MKRLVAAPSKPHHLDGVKMGDSEGRLVVVHEPRWWQLWRWWQWWRVPYKGRLTVAVGMQNISVRVVRERLQ